MMDLDSLHFASRFDGVSGSAIREIFKMIAKPGMISFAGGNPALSALPDETVAQIAADVLKHDGKAILQYGATEGYAPFLESLKQYVQEQLGCDIPAVLPVTGSTQAMDLLCKALINPGDVILVENPSFLGNLQCMKLYQANLVPVESDEGGIMVDKLEEAILRCKPKMLYTIPTFQNPTGKTLAANRRAPIAALAAKYGMVVAEDDPYRDLRYAGTPCPSIKSFDKEGWVVFLGSFSKIISPGLRVGFMAGDPRILRKCTIGKQSSDVHTANLNQAIVDQYLRCKLLPEHIAAICASYRAQLDTMLAELSTFPAGTRYTRPEGGLFIWVELPEGIDAQSLLEKAVEQHVAYVPGTHFFADGGHENTLRLNFSNSTIEQIHTGMAVLRKLIAAELDKP
ncbi:MAG: PLP-dependent aminotransferase family protein [Aristaeellaceae bacterium]